MKRFAVGDVLRGATGSMPIWLTTPPPAPSALEAIDPAWETAILRLLSKDPAERYAIAHEALMMFGGPSRSHEVRAPHATGGARRGAGRRAPCQASGGSGRRREASPDPGGQGGIGFGAAAPGEDPALRPTKSLEVRAPSPPGSIMRESDRPPPRCVPLVLESLDGVRSVYTPPC